ncbi:hypothetical protein [Hankyongella ginsenosidimutans]|uniref:hypothetical protein n=1 Tax=Hankyongella ginsenosidimutans TaxID=1763828 RepID=UPI001FE8A3F0|nr:hypothetical protein [Hankyongella ginsenosidimutans]
MLTTIAALGALAACSGEKADTKRGGERPPATVTVATAEPRQFIDRIEAVGTANALSR